MKTITKFFIDRAYYKAGDDAGNEVWLEVKYDLGMFEVLEVARVSEKMRALKRAAARNAQDMLTRKHRVNLSDKLKK
jgi:hypothetical protein